MFASHAEPPACPPLQVTGLCDPELVEALPESLRFIAHNGAGYECVEVPREEGAPEPTSVLTFRPSRRSQINIQACTDRNIQVSVRLLLSSPTPPSP